jgi:hypothetical protein
VKTHKNILTGEIYYVNTLFAVAQQLSNTNSLILWLFKLTGVSSKETLKYHLNKKKKGCFFWLVCIT